MPFEIISALAEAYVDKFTSEEDELLQKINKKTVKSHPRAHMLSGHVQGKLLTFFSKILLPKYILDIGTFTGYSALCMLKGIAENGELHTIEIRQEDADTALENFKLAENNNLITLHVGNAKNIIPTLSREWDLVFIDADKVSYIEYYELVLPHLSKRGIIIADNVLFHGQVLDPPVKGKNALAIDAFNKHVYSDSRVEQVMLSVRDGLLLIKKI
ncbi:O-methyltransferase [Segetibacter sp.]|jgi:predicted O-methyltransferase YrrM|uniref:O-methyltransferase n=1 Tax=Segetibacter sp. TaxID=2231182 RepID=UPI00261527F4|nr:O-methyltransferase [Segetibacter sp.]MCW3081435.1 O-methyltransferase [Segetibacter sp.]